MIYNKTLELKDYDELIDEVDLFKYYYYSHGEWMLVSVEHRYWEYAFLYKIIKKFIPSTDSKLLEIGSAAWYDQGTPLAPALAVDGYSVEATDLSPWGENAVKKQNEIFLDMKGELHWSLQDATNLSFGDQEFDGVFSVSVIEHIPNDLKALEEAVRVLKHGGILTFTCDFSNIQTGRLSGQERLYTEKYIKETIFPFLGNLNTYPIDQCDFSKNEENVVYSGLRYNFAIITVRKQ